MHSNSEEFSQRPQGKAAANVLLHGVRDHVCGKSSCGFYPNPSLASAKSQVIPAQGQISEVRYPR
jgi:hypothetical protein